MHSRLTPCRSVSAAQIKRVASHALGAFGAFAVRQAKVAPLSVG